MYKRITLFLHDLTLVQALEFHVTIIKLQYLPQKTSKYSKILVF